MPIQLTADRTDRHKRVQNVCTWCYAKYSFVSMIAGKFSTTVTRSVLLIYSGRLESIVNQRLRSCGISENPAFVHIVGSLKPYKKSLQQIGILKTL